MSLLDELKNKKAGLKKSETKDASGPKLTGFLSEKEIKEHAKKTFDCNIEEWQETLSDLTFPTGYVPMTIDDCKLFRAGYEAFNKDKELKKLPEDLEKKFAPLKESLTKVISEIRASEKGGVFVKLSSRSAKDSLEKKAVGELYAKYMKEDKVEEDDYNNRLIALVKAGTDVLQVFDADAAFQSLLRSERIYTDLQLALEHPDLFKQSLVVRQWVPIEVDMEWRGFVYDNKLCALSQYNYVPYFPRLVSLKDKVESVISTFFESKVVDLMKKLKQSNYVIDFAITGKDMNKIYVIEINPWGPETDSALFSFKDEQDIITKLPLTLRVRTENHPKIKETFQSAAASFL